ncbi:hypothetical protein [Amycolatopsis dongchuanensis]|uniref:Uncharacterized protein n=1 Tax=Amycolatopsis dongchuanensis TaxID=1070866 RepID=A0ABP8VDI2_9PSEU
MNTDAVTLVAIATTSTWCMTALYATHTMRTIAVKAINRAKPCDLAAVLGALPSVLTALSRLRTKELD